MSKTFAWAVVQKDGAINVNTISHTEQEAEIAALKMYGGLSHGPIFERSWHADVVAALCSRFKISIVRVAIEPHTPKGTTNDQG